MTTELARKNLTTKLAGLKQAPSTKSFLQELKAQERIDKVLLILLDTSGSMMDSMGNDRKIDVAWKIFQTQLLPNMSGWSYGIIGFGDSAYWEMYPTGSTTALALKSPIASGLTAMGQALELAWSWVKGHAKEARFILLSDGEPNDMSKEQILERVSQNRSIPIDVVGIGSPNGFSYDPNFLRQISTITGGMFSEADNIRLLADTIKKLSPVERRLLGKVQEN